MWKYVTRRFRDTLERSANHFDKRSSAFVNTSNGLGDEKNKKYSSPCCWFKPGKCWSSYQNDNDTKSKKWNFDNLNRTWIGAITWSSALVFGWYAGQLIHYKVKDQISHKKCSPTINSLIASLKHIKTTPDLKKLDIVYETNSNESVAPTVHFITNDHNGNKENSSNKSSETSGDDLGEVLKSIENRLGLAAIENGQHKDGLNLLRSAANRNHAPALYNLGLCYEMGLGVKVDEKVAMELFRSAAILDHPGALYNLGIYYGQGRGGLIQDVNTATRLLRLAAVQGQEDAISALKNLEVDIKEPTSTQEKESWTKQYNPAVQTEIVPPHSSLFFGNVTPISSYNYEPIVY